MRGEDLFFTVLALGCGALVAGRIATLVRARRYHALSVDARHTLSRQVVALAILSAALGALLLAASLAGLWQAIRDTFTPAGTGILIFCCLAYAVRLRGKADTLGQPRLRPEEAVAAAWIVGLGGDTTTGGDFGGGDGG